jgi:hypothetical protein
MTSKPFCENASAAWEPMKPAAPVTRMTGLESGIRMQISLSDFSDKSIEMIRLLRARLFLVLWREQEHG